MKRLLILALVLFGVFTFQSNAHTQSNLKIKLIGNVLYVEGDITNELTARVRNIYEGYKFTTISIKSRGGIVDAGMDIAVFVQNNNIGVNVNEYCNSACSFMFVVSPNATMSEKAVIGIHNISLTPVSGVSRYTTVTLASSIQMAQNAAVMTGVMFGMYAAAGIPGQILMQAAEVHGANMITLHRSDMVEYGIVKNK